MKEELLERWRHSHRFGQDQKRPGEFRTFIVIALTASMMVVEITTGIIYGSMALLADGLHMASHSVALGINAFAYVYARRHAHNMRYSFGTGKVNTLGGYTGAILLAVFAALMAWESLLRLLDPVSIAFNQAIVVAIFGLLVNGASVFILGADHSHEHDHHHSHEHNHAHAETEPHAHAHEHQHEHHHEHHHEQQDHNLRSAYLHVLADALTSLLAIFALLVGKYTGAIWMDPLMGIVGAILVARWSIGLLRSTSAVLLDEQVSGSMQQQIRAFMEQDQLDRVVDLHVWTVGPNVHAATITIVSRAPRSPGYYKTRLAQHIQLDHVTIEVHAYHEGDDQGVLERN